MHLVNVKLIGKAGQLFCRELQLIADSPSMILKGLKANFGDPFVAFLRDNNFHLLRVKPGRTEDYGEEELSEPVGDWDFILCPVASASGGFFRIIAGVALIGLSLAVPFLGTTGLLLGASLVLGGIHQLLTPTPRTPQGENERKDSFLTDRAAGTNRLGDPIPVQFGLCRITSPFVLSSGITTEEIL